MEQSVKLDTITCCDWAELCTALPDASIDLIFIDPPYNVTQLAYEQAIDWPAFWTQAKRLLKTAHSPVISWSVQPFTTDLINSNRKWFRHEIVIVKSLATGPLDANRRPMRCHENLLVFARAGANYYAEKESVNPDTKVIRASERKKNQLGHYREVKRGGKWEDDRTRYPRDVWEAVSPHPVFGVNSNLHPSQKPLDACQKAIRLYSRPGDTVLDCFCGSGTTLIAARKENRRFVGGDSNADYCEIARERLVETDPFQDQPRGEYIQRSLFANEEK